VRLSMPPFNKPLPGVQLFENAEVYEVPVFGLRISSAIMQCFDLPGLHDMAKELRVAMLHYDVSEFIQQKMFKVDFMIGALRKRHDCQSGANAEAVKLLDRFVQDFKALKSVDINGPVAWSRWVSEHVVEECRKEDDHGVPAWMERMHFDQLLSNFGFEAATAREIQRAEFNEKKDQGHEVKTTYEQYSMRWLSKAFAGYNVVGCLTDVANLLFAMDGPPPDKLKDVEREVIGTVNRVITHLRKGDFDNLWVPTHMVHDAETDDKLAWLLLKWVHKQRKSEAAFKVLVQLPVANTDYPELEEIVETLKSSQLGCEVFRDPSARNQKAIKQSWGPYGEPPQITPDTPSSERVAELSR